MSLPIVQAQPPKERAQLNQPSLGLPACASAGEKGGTGWAITGGAVGGLFPGVGPGEALAPKLGPFLVGEESASKKKKGGGAGRIHPHPAAGQERVWAVLQFWGSRPVGFPHPLFSPRTLLQPTADVYPRSLLGKGTFVILLAGGRSTLLIPDTCPATDFLYYSSLSLIYLRPHTFPEAS